MLSLVMGPLVDLTGSALPYMVVSAASGGVATYLASRVVFSEAHMKQLTQGSF